MRKLYGWFDRKKLNIKFTIIIGTLVFIPVIIFMILFFGNAKNNIVNQAMTDITYKMNEDYAQIQKTVDLCSLSTQAILSNGELIDLLEKLDRNVYVETNEYIAFKNTTITSLERMVNSNPYLSNIRVYSSNNMFPEMFPILYHAERMEKLAWSGSFISGEWQFDYPNSVFADTMLNASAHLMALVTEITGKKNQSIAILEVAVRMDEVLPDLFQDSPDSFQCLVNRDGTIIAGDVGENGTWREYREEIVRLALAEPADIQYLVLNGQQVIIARKEIKELSGYLISLTGLGGELNSLEKQQAVMTLVLLIVFVLLIALVNYIVKKILNQLYGILAAVKRVGEGDLNVVVTDCRPNELGELGSRINMMLEKIKELMQENINREVLIKNSEIRALQNQINAHFIYNVLESIKMMAEVDERYDISDAVTALGEMLRYSMRWSTGNVTIAQEMSYIDNYLELMNLRYDYKIQLTKKIPEHIYRQEIPKMSLQPIIENAICHGIEELAADAAIYIKAYIKDGDVFIEITDSGKGMSEAQLNRLEQKIADGIDVQGGSGNGIGLKNVQDRIKIAFGNKYGISVHSQLGCYTKVMVTVPVTVKR